MGAISKDVAVRADALGKCYRLYDRPIDRLKEIILPGRREYARKFWALKGLSATILRGETVGVVGSNGAGKSTFLQLLCGIIPPSEGRIEVSGKVTALLELGAGFDPELTGRENVRIAGAVLGLSRQEIDERFSRIVEYSELGEFIDQPVKTYSNGMFVRLAFSVAINVDPDILVIDEVLAVGDVKFRQKCMASMKDFCARGTVIFASHDFDAVTELCSRALWIEKGRLVMDGQPKHVLEKYLQYTYEGTIPERVGDGGADPLMRTEGACASDGGPAVDGGEIASETGSQGDGRRQFGDRRARITRVEIGSPDIGPGVVRAGSPCEIRLYVEASGSVQRPIFGFAIRDRLGRNLMGDNSALMGKELPSLEPGRGYVVTFLIPSWPNLLEEDYTLSVAIADGTIHEHSQCHWVHDAVVFRSLSVKMPGGLFSPIDTDIRIEEA